MFDRFELFTLQVTKANRLIHKIKTEAMQEFELKSSHVSCLYYLYSMGNLTAKELCEECDEDKANVSRSLEFLEKYGYVTACPQAKRYNTPFSLTEKGRQASEKISKKIQNVLARSGNGLSDKERETFYKTFVKINENLERIAKLGEMNE